MDIAEAAEMVEEADVVVEESSGDEEEVRVVRNLSLEFFRSRLVEHFNIMFRHQRLRWAKRRGKAPRAYYDQFN